MVSEEHSSTGGSLGERIRSARKNRDMSQAQLAVRLGVEQSTIKAWETDKRAPRANRLVMLAGVLDVTFAWLLGGQDEPSLSSPAASLGELRDDLERVERRLSELVAVVAAARTRLAEIS